MTSLVEKPLGRNFIIFHPSDFSSASEVAFGHALKIALQSKAKLDLMHVEPTLSAEKPYWHEFPAVRATLTRWGVLPEGVGRQEVARVGLRVRKILKSSTDPVGTMLRHFHRFPPDMIVLATHQRGGLARWLSKAVAEPLARRSGAMTLFTPQRGRGFVSLDDGTVALKRILIPIDHHPTRKRRSERVCCWREDLTAPWENFAWFTWGAREQRQELFCGKTLVGPVKPL